MKQHNWHFVLRSVLFSDLEITFILPGRCVSITVGGHMIILNIITFSCSGNFNLIFTLYLLQYMNMYIYELEIYEKKSFPKKFLFGFKFEPGWDGTRIRKFKITL